MRYTLLLLILSMLAISAMGQRTVTAISLNGGGPKITLIMGGGYPNPITIPATCTWSSAPLTSDCSDLSSPVWTSSNTAAATIAAGGVTTGLSIADSSVKLCNSTSPCSPPLFLNVTYPPSVGIPVPALPAGITAGPVVGGVPTYTGTAMDTTYSLPTGGTTWNPTCVGGVGNAASLQNAATNYVPGDVIVLDSTCSWSLANLIWPNKTNVSHKWTYIITSAYSSLPAPGTRVTPTDAANMPKLFTASMFTADTVMTFNPGSNYLRFVGLEIYTAATGPPGCSPSNPANLCWTQNIVYASQNIGSLPIDHIVFDRCYVHASSTVNATRGFEMDADYWAVIDSDIREIKANGNDSQTIGSFFSNGPAKINNDFLEGAGENVMIGGAGGYSSSFLTANIEIQNNYFFKPLSWVPISISPTVYITVKNLLEFKSGTIVLVNNNVLENSWQASQNGYGILINPRSGATGYRTVTNDITITNNIVKNVVNGFETLANDDPDGSCDPLAGCLQAGAARRIKIYNNLITHYDESLPEGGSGGAQWGIIINDGLMDYIYQHNTDWQFNSLQTGVQSVYFDANGTFDGASSHTHNLWILDNVEQRNPNGPIGYWGQFSNVIPQYLGDPSPVNTRVRGNYFFAYAGDSLYTLPPNNLLTRTAPTFSGSTIMTAPDMTGNTSDGLQAGWLGPGSISSSASSISSGSSISANSVFH